MADIIIYGANGYTGELIAREAASRKLNCTLAGRTESKIAPLAASVGMPFRIFNLDDAGGVDRGLSGHRVLINCAGPFSRTAVDMAQGCLRTGCHYLDITGEIGVFEALAAMDRQAQEAGVMLLPGAGFDVVPSDCLAAYVNSLLSNPVELRLAFTSSGGPSHGTATTIVENMTRGGAIRRNGKLKTVPAAWRTRNIDFGPKQKTCISIPWGDVSTAYYSTGVPNIEVYMAAPAGFRSFMKASRYLAPLLGSPAGQRFLKSRIKEGGPSEEQRKRGYALLWGEVTDKYGRTAEARMRTPDGYTLTMLTALLIAQKVLAGNAPAGFKTPSLAYGADLVLEIDGVTRS